MFSKVFHLSISAYVTFTFLGCSKEKNEPNKAAQSEPLIPLPRTMQERGTPRGNPDQARKGPQTLPCFDYCGGECVLPTTGAAEGYCAVNGQIQEDMPCGGERCMNTRADIDCHSYCREQAMSAVVDDQMRAFMQSSQQTEGNIQGAYTGYCQTETAGGEALKFPQCSGSMGFCTAAQCDLAAAREKKATPGEMCAFSWEGSSFAAGIPGASATVVVQYSGPVEGWRIYSMGCAYQGNGQSAGGYEVVGPNKVSQCLVDIEAGVSMLPAMAGYSRDDAFAAFGVAVQRLDFTLPPQAALSNVLRGSQDLISCGQVMLKLNSQYTFNFLTAYNGGIMGRSATSQQQGSGGMFRDVNGQFTVTTFESRAVSVQDYMLMYKDMGTKLSAMCFGGEGSNPVAAYCLTQSTCRADGLLAGKNTAVLTRDSRSLENYRISKLECSNLRSGALDFDVNPTAWHKINLFLVKYLGSVPSDRRRMLLNRIETSFSANLDEALTSVTEMRQRRKSYSAEVAAELESTLGLSRFVAGSAGEDAHQSSCGRVFEDWASAEDVQFYIGERLNKELQTSRYDALKSHNQAFAEQKKMSAMKRLYSKILGPNLSLSPIFARALEEGKTRSATNDVGIMTDVLCGVAQRAIDEPFISPTPIHSTCSYTSPSVEGAQNTLFIGSKAASSVPAVKSAVAHVKMDASRRNAELSADAFNRKVAGLLKKPTDLARRDPREIVHGRLEEDEESEEEGEEETEYDVEEELAEGAAYVMEIVGVTCGARPGDALKKWRDLSQSFSLQEIMNKCAASDVFVSWSEAGDGEESLKDRMINLVQGNSGLLQVYERDFEGNFCENVGMNMFSNFHSLWRDAQSEGEHRQAQRSSNLQKTEWSAFLGDAIPKVYAEHQGTASVSQVLDASMGADVLCTIAWGCDMLPRTTP